MRFAWLKGLRRSLAHGLATAIVMGVWSPPALAAPPPALSDAVRKYIYQYVTDVVSDEPFRFALVDLNNDGRDDAIVLMSDSGWCGSGGCTMLIFQGVDGGFEYVCSSTVTSAPIRVSKKIVRGWRSLIVFSKGKGDVAMRFTETARYPGNPSMQPKASRQEIDAASVAIQ
jgi:hypothetical protein